MIETININTPFLARIKINYNYFFFNFKQLFIMFKIHDFAIKREKKKSSLGNRNIVEVLYTFIHLIIIIIINNTGNNNNNKNNNYN